MNVFSSVGKNISQYFQAFSLSLIFSSLIIMGLDMVSLGLYGWGLLSMLSLHSDVSVSDTLYKERSGVP